MTTTSDTKCPCSYLGAPSAPGEPDRKLHDRLLSIESMEPVEAAELVMGIALSEWYVMDSSDLRRFAMQHNFTNPAAVGDLLSLTADVMERSDYWITTRRPRRLDGWNCEAEAS